MPLTPYHLGPGLLLWVFFSRRLDLLTVLIASVIVDIEPFLVILLGLDYPLHGFFHSFLGGSMIAGSLAVLINHFRKDVGLKKVILSSFYGVFLHILLDSLLYTDIMPFFPLEFNPFYGIVSSVGVYVFCKVSIVLGLLGYFVRNRLG